MVDYDRIFNRIDKIGVSKAFVCDELGKSRSWLHAAKRKRSKLSNQTVERLAHILLTTPEYLRGETDDLGIKNAPVTKTEADKKIDLEIMMKYAQLVPEDRMMIDAMIDRLLSQRGR